MKQQGFAITGVLYVLLIIFLASLTMLLFHLQNRKMLLDQLKLDVVEAVESENNYEYLLNKISELESKINQLNNSITLPNRISVNESDTVGNRDSEGELLLYTFVAPKDGIYIFTGYVGFPPNKEGVRTLSILGNTNSYVQVDAASTFYTYLPIAESHYMKEGEKYEFRVCHTSSVTLRVQIVMTIEYSN